MSKNFNAKTHPARQPSAPAPANGQAKAYTPPADPVAALLARVVNLHMEGKPKEALDELQRGMGPLDENAELLSACGHLQCELELYEEA
jgi:hypothetical protein